MLQGHVTAVNANLTGHHPFLVKPHSLGLLSHYTAWVVQDWTQQQQRHKAALDTEIKTLRSQIGEACFAFDDSLVDLQMQRTAAESELTTVELQLASLVASHEQQLFLQSELEKVASEASRVHEQLDAKQALLSDVVQALIR